MAIAKMQKAAILVSHEKVREVLSKIQEFGVFEAIENTAEADSRPLAPDELRSVESKLADLRFAIRFLTPFAPAPKTLRQKLLGEKIESTEDEAIFASQNDFSPVIEECIRLEEERNRINADAVKLRETNKALLAWKNLDVPLDFNRDSEDIGIRLGSVETKDYIDFGAEIRRIPMAHVQKISETAKNTYFLIIFHAGAKSEVHPILESYRFSEMDFTGLKGTVSDEIRRLATESKDLRLRGDENDRKRSALTVHLKDMKLAHDALVWQKEKKDVIEKSFGTETTVFLTGWIREDAFSAVRNEIAKITDLAEFSRIDADENDVPPVQLQNTSSFRPFETVTRFFGFPSKGEIDPTPFLAPFFAIFFGFCLTDFGYGVLLTVSFLLALKIVPANRDVRDMLKLLVLCGVSTIILGILFGGYFGLTKEQIPFLVNPATGNFYGQVFDPVNDLVPGIMIFAYGLGIAQLLLGVVLSGVVRIRKGDNIGFWTVTIPTVLVVLLVIAWGVAKQGILFGGAEESIGTVILILLLVLIWSMGPAGNPFVRPLLGLLILANELIGWVSNILSYSRLFALGLATGIIAMSFNQIAATVGADMPLILAIPVMLVIILFGHSLNLGLNFIGALVHTARLQFVEFFGRFFEGGAREFHPLSRRLTYVFDPKK